MKYRSNSSMIEPHVVILLLILFMCSLYIIGCGNSIPSRIDVVNSGTSKIELTVSLELINQLKDLCTKQLSPVVFPTRADMDKAISDCVFAHLNMSTGSATFGQQYCTGADLSGYTPEQISTIETTCQALGF